MNFTKLVPNVFYIYIQDALKLFNVHSFPTRRSSDLISLSHGLVDDHGSRTIYAITAKKSAADRKSTRLNSSHVSISYAVFCLKKKILYRYPGCIKIIYRLS